MSRLSPAEKLLTGLGVRDPDDIDLEAIAYSEGVTVNYRILDGCEARIIGIEDKAVITVDSRVMPSRKRFSLGHELGHWHHDRGRSFTCRPEDIGNRSRRNRLDPERVADAYAADLLMPQYIFEPMALDGKKCSFKSVEALRKKFRTSITATALRIVDFGPEPAMLVCHTANGRKWFYPHKHIPEYWFPSDELDADSYAMGVLFGKEDHSRRVLMPADSWFDRRGSNEYEIYEETKQIHDGEILTLLIFKDAEMLSD